MFIWWEGREGGELSTQTCLDELLGSFTDFKALFPAVLADFP